MVKIDKKIVGYEVVTNSTKEQSTPQTSVQNSVRPPALIKRPDGLSGTTYRIAPYGEASYYITINNIEIDGTLYPYELFIASKVPDTHEWRIAVSRLISAFFRLHLSVAPKDWTVNFLVRELKSIYASSGYHSRGKFFKSILHHIGHVLEEHLIQIKYLKPQQTPASAPVKAKNPHQQLSATLPACPKCFEHALTIMDNCETCLNCGYSKCG